MTSGMTNQPRVHVTVPTQASGAFRTAVAVSVRPRRPNLVQLGRGRLAVDQAVLPGVGPPPLAGEAGQGQAAALERPR